MLVSNYSAIIGIIFYLILKQIIALEYPIAAFELDNTIRSTKSKNVLLFMNQTTLPCHDFYTFTCGNWAKYQYAYTSSANQTLTTFDTMIRDVDQALQNILEESINLDDGNAGLKMKEFYQSCITADNNGVFFSELIKSNGGFPAVTAANWHNLHNNDYNWQHIVAKLRHQYGLNILIGLDIDINFLSEDENSLYLVEPHTNIPEILCNKESTQNSHFWTEEYQQIVRSVADNLQHWLAIKRDAAQQVAKDIMRFEYQLCAGMRAEKEDFVQQQHYYPYYKRKTLGDLTIEFNNSIDFNAYATTSFGAVLHKPVFMQASNYYQHLIALIDQTNKTTLANYIMYSAFAALNFPIKTKPEKHCLSLVKRHFSKVLGYMYERKYADVIKVRSIEQMFYRLKSVMHLSLRHSEWMGEATSRAALERLSEISLHFANYESYLHVESGINAHNFWQNLKIVLAQTAAESLEQLRTTGVPEPKDKIEAYDVKVSYNRLQKRITVGLGLLQAPHYQEVFPNALHFATTGYLIARELVKAFDDTNWSTNTLSPYFWDPATARAYQIRLECFRKQMSNYYYEQPNTLQNMSYVREIVASSNGLNIAFRAYLDWLHYMSPNNDFTTLSKETLEDLNFSNTQLFFIAFAQLFCQARSQQAQPKVPIFSSLQTHTMERFWINAPLANYIEFAREFNCAAGDELHPADKCLYSTGLKQSHD